MKWTRKKNIKGLINKCKTEGDGWYRKLIYSDCWSIVFRMKLEIRKRKMIYDIYANAINVF